MGLKGRSTYSEGPILESMIAQVGVEVNPIKQVFIIYIIEL